MEQAGNPLDNYEPLEVIGTGSFGTIRKVRRKLDGQIFARKELNFERMTERDRKQIVAEVNILKDLDHEHIVRYHDRFVDRDNGILYIVMEYCGGGDLAAIIQRCRREGTMLPEDTIWSYFLQIVLALHQCHHPGVKVHTGTTPASPDTHDAVTKQRGQVLHRDIKPENVFLNGDGVVKMGDFGLSKQLASASFANTYVGTPYYMSPEVMQEKAYDSKSDIWSLGCLLYELCALNPPFHEAKTHTELSHFIRSGRIPPLPRVYSSSLTQVIKAMLNVNPAMRPSAQQLLQHERLDLAFKLANMEKMVRQVKAMKAQLAQKEADVSARERELEAHAAAFRTFLSQKETEVRAAMEARERELTEAMMARERELCAGVLRREEELRARWEEREEEIRVAWEARELEMVAREEAVRKEEERLEALRVELESAKGKKEQPTKCVSVNTAARCLLISVHLQQESTWAVAATAAGPEDADQPLHSQIGRRAVPCAGECDEGCRLDVDWGSSTYPTSAESTGPSRCARCKGSGQTASGKPRCRARLRKVCLIQSHASQRS
ncbi:Pkinase-domain-containing protein [Auricularia subglabra TFB-10046 SS5]|nr:Pkinase-domain-containing protein [Auricularia subglabra TFB-10046 SS5]